VRRVALVTTTAALLLALAACNDDGRTLRPAQPDQTASVSTTAPAATDDPTFDDPDTPLGGAASTTVAASIPPATTAFTLVALWRNGAPIDSRYTCDGPNVAPALSWSAAPAGTVEIAITLTDLDATAFIHWAIAGIPPGNIALDEDTVPLEAYEAANSLGDVGYTGPCPPAGSTHRYTFTVHYLGEATGLDDGTPAASLISAISASETATAEVTGTFSRS